MANGVNKAIILGRLGQDPEIRYTKDNKAVATLSVATSESWKDKQTGEKKEQTEWHRVVLFGKLAEVAGEYLRKGSQVYIEGQLKTRKWTDQQGVERYSTEINIGMNGVMQMIGGGNQQVTGNTPKQSGSQASAGNAPGGQNAPYDDDIPF